jgi:hypothetical protein
MFCLVPLGVKKLLLLFNKDSVHFPGLLAKIRKIVDFFVTSAQASPGD